jgi:hypothetical protein
MASSSFTSFTVPEQLACARRFERRIERAISPDLLASREIDATWLERRVSSRP